MQGVYDLHERFKRKKHLLAAVKERPGDVFLEATSVFGNEYDGPLDQAPEGGYYLVGPSPRKRVWYASILVAVKPSGERSYIAS